MFVLKNYSALQFINIGVGADITIAEFARTVADMMEFRGNITYYASKRDGMPTNLLDISRLAAPGWNAKTPLQEGLTKPIVIS